MKLTCETEINWTQRLKKVGRNKYIAYWKSHNFKIRESGKWKEQIEQWIVILENINHEWFWVRGAVCILWGVVGVWIRTRELRVQTSSKILEYDITPRKLGIYLNIRLSAIWGNKMELFPLDINYVNYFMTYPTCCPGTG